MYRNPCVLLHFIAPTNSPPDESSNRLGLHFWGSFFHHGARDAFSHLCPRLGQELELELDLWFSCFLRPRVSGNLEKHEVFLFFETSGLQKPSKTCSFLVF